MIEPTVCNPIHSWKPFTFYKTVIGPTVSNLIQIWKPRFFLERKIKPTVGNPIQVCKPYILSRTNYRTDGLKPDSELQTIHFCQNQRSNRQFETRFRHANHTVFIEPTIEPTVWNPIQTCKPDSFQYTCIAAFLVKFGGVQPVPREWPFVSNLRGLLRAPASGVAARFMMVWICYYQKPNKLTQKRNPCYCWFRTQTINASVLSRFVPQIYENFLIGVCFQ